MNMMILRTGKNHHKQNNKPFFLMVILKIGEDKDLPGENHV